MLYILIIIILVVGLDQSTKFFARKKFKEKGVEKGPFTFGLIFNQGAFKGLFKKKPDLLLKVQIVGSLIVFLLTIMSHFVYKNKILTTGFSLLTGGAIGNLIDRLTDGRVTDFLAIKWTKDLYYNLADFAIFAGGILVVIFEIYIELKNAWSGHS